jgi:hypothetical protein
VNVNTTAGFVVLATANYDLGVFSTHKAWSAARDYANRHRVLVLVRDPVTDETIDTIKPR